jgi:hypothetical protein
MAVRDENDKSTQQSQQAGNSTVMSEALGDAMRSRTGAQQTRRESGFSFRNMGSMSRLAMGRTPASEVLSKMNKALGDVLKENIDQSFETTLIPIDMNNTMSLGVSALVLVIRDKMKLDLGAAYHTLILEGSAEAPAPRFENIGGQNVEIVRVTGDADDQIMFKEVQETVAKQFPQSRLMEAGSCVVPRDFNLADANMVHRLAANAAFAASSELETSNPAFQDLNLANAEKDASLVVRTTFNNPQTVDPVGLPIRSDVVIDFQAAPISQQSNQQQAVERVSQVAQVTGFVDLVWDPAVPQPNPYMMAAPQSYQRYLARFVMTSLESTSLLTIPAQLLALMPALSLRENNLWVQAFRSPQFGSDVDLHDIGAVGIEANFVNDPSGYGPRIDTKADSFKPEHLHKLVASTVRPGLILSLDVPECGPQTWYNRVFAAAAGGNANANAAIINAANVLTNGAFGKYFPSNGKVAVDENNRIHMGYYTDRNGIRKDIRDIDYLAVLNLVGEKDPAVAREWSDTFQRVNYPLAQRLAARKRILTGLVSEVQITGFACRVTFEVEFVDALARACVDAGLVIRAVTPFGDLTGYERATAQFAGQTLMSGEATGIFNRGNFGQAASGFGSGRRWSW